MNAQTFDFNCAGAIEQCLLNNSGKQFIINNTVNATASPTRFTIQYRENNARNWAIYDEGSLLQGFRSFDDLEGGISSFANLEGFVCFSDGTLDDLGMMDLNIPCGTRLTWNETVVGGNYQLGVNILLYTISNDTWTMITPDEESSVSSDSLISDVFADWCD